MKFSFAKFKISSMLVFKNHPSIRFCFIYLTHFISVMGLYCKTLKFIHYIVTYHLCLQNIHTAQCHPFYVKYHFTQIKFWFISSWKVSDFVHVGHFYPCLKFHLCRQFLSQHMDSSDTYLTHTGVSSHIIQYAHSGNQALAVEHIVRYHHRISKY